MLTRPRLAAARLRYVSTRGKYVLTIWALLMVASAGAIGIAVTLGASSAPSGSGPPAAANAATSTRGASGVVARRPSKDAQAVARRACARGDAFFQLKRWADASTAYARAVGINPCGAAGLQAVSQRTAALQPQATYDVVRTLQDAGMRDAANEVLTDAVKTGDLQAVPAELRSGSSLPGGVQRVMDTVGPILLTAALVIAGMLLLLWIAQAITSLLGWWGVGPGVRLGSVTGGKSDTASDAANSHLTAVLRQRLADVGEGAPNRQHVRFISADAVELPDADAIDQVSKPAGVLARLLVALPNIVARIEPTASVTVLKPDPQRGVGVTTEVMGGRGRERLSETLWESSYGTVDASEDATARAQYLMLPAAIWLSYNGTGRQPLPRRADVNEVRLDTGEIAWQSAACSACGAVAHQRGRLGVATQQYRKALDWDPANAEARYNLASIMIEPVPVAAQSALSPEHRLNRVETLLMPMADGDDGDPRTLRSQWLMAMARLYREDWAGASGWLNRLDTSCQALKRERPTADLCDLADRLGELREGMRRTILMVTGESDPGPYLPVGWVTGELRYNAACYLARRYGANHSARDREDALNCLTDALGTGDALARRVAPTDPAFVSLREDPAFKQLFASDAKPEPKSDGQRRLAFYASAEGPMAVEVDA